MSDRCYHGVTPAEECTECVEPESNLGYAQGRADERAAIVAWLRDDGSFMSMLFATLRAHDRDLLAITIERGCHEKEKP